MQTVDAPPSTDSDTTPPDPKRWFVLAVVMVGTFMAVVDDSIVNVAIPAIRSDLHAPFAQVKLVVAAYTLAYGVLLVTGGRLGDIFGHKGLFIVGLLAFTAVSEACSAPTPTSPPTSGLTVRFVIVSVPKTAYRSFGYKE